MNIINWMRWMFCKLIHIILYNKTELIVLILSIMLHSSLFKKFCCPTFLIQNIMHVFAINIHVQTIVTMTISLIKIKFIYKRLLMLIFQTFFKNLKLHMILILWFFLYKTIRAIHCFILVFEVDLCINNIFRSIKQGYC